MYMRTHVTFFGIYPLFEKAAMQMPPFLSEIVLAKGGFGFIDSLLCIDVGTTSCNMT